MNDNLNNIQQKIIEYLRTNPDKNQYQLFKFARSVSTYKISYGSIHRLLKMMMDNKIIEFKYEQGVRTKKILRLTNAEPNSTNIVQALPDLPSNTNTTQ